MNAPQPSRVVEAPLAATLFALMSQQVATDEAPEAQWLRQWAQVGGQASANSAAAWQAWMASPPAHDRQLHAIARELRLTAAEVIAVQLATLVEVDAMAGRALAWLQAPTGGSRPSVALVAMLACQFDGALDAAQVAALQAGRALACGLLQVDAGSRPWAEGVLRVPVPMALALSGSEGRWPQPLALPDEECPLAGPTLGLAEQVAGALGAAEDAVMVRAGHALEGRALARAVARRLRREAVFLGSEVPAGLGPWAWLTRHLPVLSFSLAPGESRELPALAGYRGPVLVLTGREGGVVRDGTPLLSWTLPLPAAHERARLWQQCGADAELASEISAHRQGAGRIHALSRAARALAAAEGMPGLRRQDIDRVARKGAAADLGALAELVTEDVDDAALVMPPALRAELEALLARCRHRDQLGAALGPALRARERPGVRALVHGPSGTGTALAAGKRATARGLPLYRVDMASVTSKYIGETEKNLAQLFAAAEYSDVILLFDEADALFGKRTEVKNANDRFANAQTNYLLQRIETFDGIAILTSNSRSRFDSAFARRLDLVIEFPQPLPAERKALWHAHLGDGHALGQAELNQLAAGCELAGGHVRNAVLWAAAQARAGQRDIAYDDLAEGIAAEYRKLGKPCPPGLRAVGR